MLYAVFTLLFLLPYARAGVGITAHRMENTTSIHQHSFSMQWLPTFDYQTDSFLIQLNLLETLASLPQENLLRLGGNGYYVLRQSQTSSNTQGIVQLGFALDVTQDNTIQNNEFTEVWARLQTRIGIQMSEDYGCGIYIVPSLGWAHIPISQDTGISLQHDFVVGGGLQFSVWKN